MTTDSPRIVRIDYSRSLLEMVKKGGYDHLHNDINAQRFPVKGEGQVELEITLASFNQEMRRDNALIKLDSAGLRPVTLAEVLALGATPKKVLCERPIVALGSIWANPDGSYDIPYVRKWWNKRGVYLYWTGYAFSSCCQFGATRKEE